MITPTPEQQQAIADFVEARAEEEIDVLQEALATEFPANVVEWWSAQWLDLLAPPSPIAP